MIQHNYTSKGNQNVKKPFRYRGPLDAYIYQEGGDNKNMEDIQDQMLVHLPTQQKILHIFTDGACRNNGKPNASAAWGILIVTDGSYSVVDQDSGDIPRCEAQTNQRAELRALLRGLEVAESYIMGNPEVSEICIWSDSQYAIKCTSEWGPTWKKNNWTKRGGDIQHLDLIQRMVDLYIRFYSKLRLKWLEGHKGGEQQHAFPWCFNHRVDALANSALRK